MSRDSQRFLADIVEHAERVERLLRAIMESAYRDIV
jgi:hypothetical protein